MSTLNPDSPETRTRRLKHIRNIASLSREEMCNGGKINRYTLISWKNGRLATNDQRCGKIFAKAQKEDVYYTVEWLMDGKGPQPSGNHISPSSIHKIKYTVFWLSLLLQ